MAQILVHSGRLIDPASGLDAPRDLLIEDGQIARIAPKIEATPQAERVDATGLWVVPGFIDLHAHLREPGEEYKETIATGTRAAVAGGYTTVVAMPNTKPPNDSAAVTELILSRARAAALARVIPAGAITRGLEGRELSEMGELVASGCRILTDDGRPVMNAGVMRRALEYAQIFGVPVMVHEEDLELSSGGAMNEGPIATRLGLPGIPAAAEVSMVARDLVLLEETGGRLHVAHVSCEGSVRAIRAARSRGLKVTCEVAPHHFTLTDSAVESYSTHAKMMPPLRAEADRQALLQAMADGTVDAIATDHAPHSSVEKDVELDRAANGVVGLETALPLTLELVRTGLLSIQRALELLTSGPARVLGLPLGTLAIGAPADVTLIDPERCWTVEAARFFSRSRNTPFEGRKMQGKVMRTLVGGRTVHQELP